MPRALAEQVIVITGASSGIGRETALQAAKQGASVVAAARNETALNEVVNEIERQGGRALAVVTDVAEWPQVERLARAAVDHFGRINTWINNAAVSTYGTIEQMSVEEMQRVIQVNLMGQIHGVKAVLPHMRRQGQGAIINVASPLGVRSVPLQAAYSASKHGIKGFTEALRMELEHEKAGITVTLVLPPSVNTPLFNHARSKLGVLPRPIPPIYDPGVVAEAILFAAENPRRRIVVGAGKMLTMLERISPTLLDWYMSSGGRMFKQQRTQWPDDGRDNLFEPSQGPGASKGVFGQESIEDSPYTRYLEVHPTRKWAVSAALAGLGLFSLVRLGNQRRSE